LNYFIAIFRRDSMNILVTGGSGMFGGKTILYLLKDPDVKSVVSLDIVPPKEWVIKSMAKDAKKFHFVKGSVAEITDILNVISKYKIDRIIHWAFIMISFNAPTDPRLAVKVNVNGVSNAFEAAKIMGVKRVIYASSETVYGPQAMYGEREVTEEDQTNPQHSYAVCKKLAEILADNYTDQFGMSFTGVRPTIGYGLGSRTPAQYWSDMITSCAVGKPFAMEGDGNELASLVSADDLAELTRLLIKAKSSPHPVYNVGGPATSPRQLAQAIKKYIPDAKITFGKKATLGPDSRIGGLPWLVSDKLAKKDFGFTCMPMEKAVLIHINDARLEAGLKPIKG
jgi:nucleoside-diphosphate-sugar epimerase